MHVYENAACAVPNVTLMIVVDVVTSTVDAAVPGATVQAGALV
jgi:hypothetical protein